MTPRIKVDLRCWDEEYVLFLDPPGDTHLLDPFSAHLITALQKGEAPVASLAERVAGTLDTWVDDELVHHVEGTLLSLRSHGIVEIAHR
ncbi:MAG: HPr-rel-A system PqqD family peptide chaperone [Gammaproteobacteria bacterium]